MPDKHEVDGSIPFEPTKRRNSLKKHIEKYIDEKQVTRKKLEKF